MTAYSFKRRFVAPIQTGLGMQPHIPGTDYVPKRQTIRAVGKRRHAQAGGLLQLYTGMRTKQCFKIGDARCRDVRPIIMEIGNDADISVYVDRGGGGYRPYSEEMVEEFARRDGFGSVEDMWLFWRQEHAGINRFEGYLIEWEPIR